MSKTVLAAVEIADDRRSDRANVKITAGLRTSRGKRFPVVVRNLSCHGFLAEVPVALIPGSLITLDVSEGHSFDARVAWSRDGHVGAAFNLTLSEENLAAIM